MKLQEFICAELTPIETKSNFKNTIIHRESIMHNHSATIGFILEGDQSSYCYNIARAWNHYKSAAQGYVWTPEEVAVDVFKP